MQKCEPVGDRLKVAAVLTFLFLLLEVWGGYISGSMALLSDAAHMFRDMFSLLLSLAALRIGCMLPQKRTTFGLHRTEIFSAIVNGVLLVIVALLILQRSIEKFGSPTVVQSLPMIIIAIAGLAINVYVAWQLHGYDDLNVRGAYLHVLTDTLSSAAVLAGGVAILFTANYIIDPIISMVIAVFTLGSTFQLLSDSLHILLEGTPKGIDIDDVIHEMKKVDGVLDVHGVHLWSLCSNINVLDAHIHSCEKKVSDTCRIIEELNKRLEKFNIRHTTFQFECDRCEMGKLKHIEH